MLSVYVRREGISISLIQGVCSIMKIGGIISLLIRLLLLLSLKVCLSSRVVNKSNKSGGVYPLESSLS